MLRAVRSRPKVRRFESSSGIFNAFDYSIATFRALSFLYLKMKILKESMYKKKKKIFITEKFGFFFSSSCSSSLMQYNILPLFIFI